MNANIYRKSLNQQFIFLGLLATLLMAFGAVATTYAETFKGTDVSGDFAFTTTLRCGMPQIENGPVLLPPALDEFGYVMTTYNTWSCIPEPMSPEGCSVHYPYYLDLGNGNGRCSHDIPRMANPFSGSIHYLEFPEGAEEDPWGTPPTNGGDAMCEGMGIVSPVGGEDTLLTVPNGEPILFNWTEPDNVPEAYELTIRAGNQPIYTETITVSAPATQASVPLRHAGFYSWAIAVPGRCIFRSQSFFGNVVDNDLDEASIVPNEPTVADAPVAPDAAVPAAPAAPASGVGVCEGLQPTSPSAFAYAPTVFYWDAPADASQFTAYEVRVYDSLTGDMIIAQRIDDPNATNMEIDLGAAMFGYSNVGLLASISWGIVAYNGDAALCEVPMDVEDGNNVDFRRSPWDPADDTLRSSGVNNDDETSDGDDDDDDGDYCDRNPQNCQQSPGDPDNF